MFRDTNIFPILIQSLLEELPPTSNLSSRWEMLLPVKKPLELLLKCTFVLYSFKKMHLKFENYCDR